MVVLKFITFAIALVKTTLLYHTKYIKNWFLLIWTELKTNKLLFYDEE